MAQNFAHLARVSDASPSAPTRFVLPLEGTSDDNSVCLVRLCSGAILHVPASVLANSERRGRVHDGAASRELISLELDTSNNVGVLIQEMANEIDRLAQENRLLRQSLVTATSPKEGTQVEKAMAWQGPWQAMDARTLERVQVPVTGIACQVNIANFTPDRDIAAFALAGSQYCQVANVERVSSRWLRIVHGAPNGSICGGQYSGKVFLDVQWI